MVSCTTYSPAALLDLLSAIPDPEIPVITIREIGMLQGVRLDQDTYVVTITPTYTACPAMKMIEDEILRVCSEHDVSNVRVELTYSPAWSTEWITAGAREKLKQYGIAPPSKKACSGAMAGEIICCPRCGSKSTGLISRFGSTACKSLYKCKSCLEPFEYFKCH